jgi:hypothetical protein
VSHVTLAQGGIAILPFGATSLRRAAWAGLQDSMPRAALLSIHARVAGTTPNTWQHSSLVQLWGPRFNDYLVSARDRAVFTLGRLPQDARTKAQETASQLSTFLNGRRMPFGQAGRAMGVPPNSLRYAALTGTIHLHWDGARQPVVWTVSAPKTDPRGARLELARRYLHIFGPTTPEAFARWAGLSAKEARATIAALTGELTPVRTPVGAAWILAKDEATFRAPRPHGVGVRFLPSGDAYYLVWGADRALLVPEAKRRAALWTTRVWPGAMLIDGEIVGTWRRTGRTVTISEWRKLTAEERKAVSVETELLPLR